jgi:hypothetical protein
VARDPSTQNALLAKQREQTKRFFIAKDLLFILSELSGYLEAGSPVCLGFLEVIVQIMSIRQLHSSSKSNDDVLSFGARCISMLIPKVGEGALKAEVIDQIMRIFLRVKSPKVRARLSTGLASSLASVKT